jgi:hypothetical protein
VEPALLSQVVRPGRLLPQTIPQCVPAELLAIFDHGWSAGGKK